MDREEVLWESGQQMVLVVKNPWFQRLQASKVTVLMRGEGSCRERRLTPRTGTSLTKQIRKSATSGSYSQDPRVM